MTRSELNKIVEQWGTPLYIFWTNDFCDNFKSLVKSFRSYYPNYIPAYSYKTNYTPFICKLVKQLGGYAEVVSDMELMLAMKLGYKPSQIVYNGPDKGPMMENHILSGGISNIDHIYEARRVKLLADNNKDRIIRVGLRINADVGNDFTSRFGIDSKSDDLKKVLSLLHTCSNVRLSGLHLHVSRSRGIEAWRNRITSILIIADRVFQDAPDYIDIGSGMFADMEESLRSQFVINVPTYDQYAEAVASVMSTHYNKSPKKPILMTEPGTTLVSRYLSLITMVKGLKSIKDKRYAIVDSDIHNAGETCLFMKLPYTLFHIGESERLSNPDVVGYTCLEQDCIYKNMPEDIGFGDIIEFRNVGGYSIVYKPPFILPNCGMIASQDNGSFIEIKRAETFDDVFNSYVF